MSGVELSNAQALNLWRNAHVELVRESQSDITARQLAILLQVYLTPAPHTVRSLAAALGVSKPVITRALDTLGQRGLLRRRRDQNDRRSVFVERTGMGSAYLASLSDLIVAAGADA